MKAGKPKPDVPKQSAEDKLTKFIREWIAEEYRRRLSINRRRIKANNQVKEY